MNKVIQEINEDSHGNLFNAKTFLDYLRPSNPHWWEQGDNQEICRWVFRGHASSDWKLIPSVFRNGESNALYQLVRYFDSLPPSDYHPHWDKISTNEKEYYLISLSYSQAIFEFYNLSYELGLLPVLTVDRWPQSLMHYTTKFASDHIRCFTDYPNTDIHHRTTREIYEIAQHYGLPTHLLDWSKSPIYAAHFATNAWLELKEKTDIVVWALKEFEVISALDEKCLINVQMLTPFIGNNSYAKVQLGRFTVVAHQNAKSYFQLYGTYPALEDILSASDPKFYRLEKIVLSKNHVQEFRRLLDREGITEAKLKPTLDSVVSTIKSRWKNL
jgi:FRG domain